MIIIRGYFPVYIVCLFVYYKYIFSSWIPDMVSEDEYSKIESLTFLTNYQREPPAVVTESRGCKVRRRRRGGEWT